jgi:hypothetical protein
MALTGFDELLHYIRGMVFTQTQFFVFPVHVTNTQMHRLIYYYILTVKRHERYSPIALHVWNRGAAEAAKPKVAMNKYLFHFQTGDRILAP